MAITFWSFPSSAWSGWGDGLGPQHSVGAVIILGYHVGSGIFWRWPPSLSGWRIGRAAHAQADPLRAEGENFPAQRGHAQPTKSTPLLSGSRLVVRLLCRGGPFD